MGIFSSGNKASKSTSGTTIVAAGTCIKGALELSCNLHVDGEVIGDIISQGVVSIGKNGRITGAIEAEALLVSGFYDGQCQVNTLDISKSGHVEGEIKAKELVVAKGGSFNGQCTDMSATALSEVTPLRLESSTTNKSQS